MLLFVTVLHFVVAALLIVFVLLQDSKGGGVFGVGGAGSGQVFSTTGAANFFVKATRILAVSFAVTCLALTYLTTHKSDSVVDGFVPPAATVPATDATAPATTNAPAADLAPAPSENKDAQKPVGQ